MEIISGNYLKSHLLKLILRDNLEARSCPRLGALAWLSQMFQLIASTSSSNRHLPPPLVSVSQWFTSRTRNSRYLIEFDLMSFFFRVKAGVSRGITQGTASFFS